MQMKGKVNVNDDAGLEKEADVMGAKALQMNTNLTQLQPVVQKQNKIHWLLPLCIDLDANISPLTVNMTVVIVGSLGCFCITTPTCVHFPSVLKTKREKKLERNNKMQEQ